MVDKLRTGWRRLSLQMRVFLCLALIGGGVWFAWAQGGGDTGDESNNENDASVVAGASDATAANVLGLAWLRSQDPSISNEYLGGGILDTWCEGASI